MGVLAEIYGITVLLAMSLVYSIVMIHFNLTLEQFFAGFFHVILLILLLCPGCILNPAVVIAQFLLNKISFFETLGMVTVHLSLSLLIYQAVHCMCKENMFHPISCYPVPGVKIGDGVTMETAFWAEFTMTFLINLIGGLLSFRHRVMQACWFSFVICILAYQIAPYSGGSLNPVVSFGLKWIHDEFWTRSHFYVYFCANVLGALFGQLGVEKMKDNAVVIGGKCDVRAKQKEE